MQINNVSIKQEVKTVQKNNGMDSGDFIKNFKDLIKVNQKNYNLDSKNLEDKKSNSTDLAKKNSKELSKSTYKNRETNLADDKKKVAKEKEEEKKISLSQESVLPDLLIMTLEEFSNLLTEKISLELEVSSEYIKDILDTLDFQPYDLLEVENAVSFYLLVKGDSDMVNIITSEELTKEYTSYLELLKNMQDELEAQIKELQIETDNKAEASFELEPAQFIKNLLSNMKNQSHPLETPKDDIKDDFYKEEMMIKETEIELDKEDINIPIDDTVDNKDTGSSSNGWDHTSYQNDFIKDLSLSSTNEQEIGIKDNNNTDFYDLSKQIIEQIKVRLEPDQSSMEINLYPEHLGKLSFQVISKNSILTASFVTENEVTKEAIENQLHVLKEQLSNQGLEVEHIEVEVGVSNYHLDHNNQANSNESKQPKQSQHNKKAMVTWSTEDGEDSMEPLTTDYLLNNYDSDLQLNTVNYSA